VHIIPEQVEWTTAALVVLVGYGIALWFVWGHFRSPIGVNKLGRNIGSEVQRANENTKLDALRIEIAHGPQFEEYTLAGAAVWHNIGVSVRNDGNGWLTECRIAIKDIQPSPAIRLPHYLLDGVFELNNPGQRKRVHVAKYNEGIPDLGKVFLSNPHHFSTPFTGSAIQQLHLPRGSYIVTIEVSASECRSAEAHFRLWIDEVGHLRFEGITSAAGDPKPIEPQIEWKLPPKAQEAFITSELIASLEACREKSSEAFLARDRCERELMSITSETPREVAETRSVKYRSADLLYGVRSDEYREAFGAVRDEMLEKLRNGSLVAKGFRVPHQHGALEVIIPAAEWKFLVLFADEARAAGLGIEYRGLEIGRVR
jgi:hypothetical protein